MTRSAARQQLARHAPPRPVAAAGGRHGAGGEKGGGDGSARAEAGAASGASVAVRAVGRTVGRTVAAAARQVAWAGPDAWRRQRRPREVSAAALGEAAVLVAVARAAGGRRPPTVAVPAEPPAAGGAADWAAAGHYGMVLEASHRCEEGRKGRREGRRPSNTTGTHTLLLELCFPASHTLDSGGKRTYLGHAVGSRVCLGRVQGVCRVRVGSVADLVLASRCAGGREGRGDVVLALAVRHVARA